MDANEQLLNINQDLLSKGIKLRIEKRGGKLNIRGPLPDKKSPTKFKVQRISLRLSNDSIGLKEARKILELIVFQLDKDQFSWSNWTKEKDLTSIK